MTRDEREALRRCFRTTFDSREGKTILAWIAKECGAFETDPKKISPDLQAFFNRLLWTSGLPALRNQEKLLDAVINIASNPEPREEEDYATFV